jgi:hypothetical protein
MEIKHLPKRNKTLLKIKKASVFTFGFRLLNCYFLSYFQHTHFTAAEFTLSIFQRYFKNFYFLRR